MTIRKYNSDIRCKKTEEWPQNSERKLFPTNNSLLRYPSVKPKCKLKPFSDWKRLRICISHTSILLKLLEDIF